MNALLLWDAGSDWEDRSLDSRYQESLGAVKPSQRPNNYFFVLKQFFHEQNYVLLEQLKNCSGTKKIVLEQI